MKRVRWECPNGCAGVLGPSRPRKDDVARFCLACSAKGGRLVARSAPALDRVRESRCARRQEKSKNEAVRDRAKEDARWTVAGYDMRDALKLAWSLPVAKEWCERRRLPKRPPSMHLRLSREQIRGALGRAWYWRHHIQVRAIIGDASLGPFDTLLHEVAHILSPERGHGSAFRARLEKEWEEIAEQRGMPKLGAAVDSRFLPRVPKNESDEGDEGDEGEELDEATDAVEVES